MPSQGGWRGELQRAVRSVGELAELLELSPAELQAYAPKDFPLLVPRSFVARMRKGDPNDPLLRQILPSVAERKQVAGFGDDPLEEVSLSRDGVLDKYPGRVLLIASQSCPVHCRYCFRRAFPYREQLASRGEWARAIARLSTIPGLREVILSGGDPLSLSDRRLETLLAALAPLPTLERVRIHTRYPVVLPERIDRGLVGLLARAPRPLVIVIHANHPNEIDSDVGEALERLAATGAQLLNQSVLLRGINDDAETLARLSERLAAARTLPYYLHMLDPVSGAAHYEVDEATARALHRALAERLPGYLVPRLVREIPGRLSKTLIA